MTQSSPPRLILVGRVAGAFGVRGELRISTYTADPLALVGYGELKREDGAPALKLTQARAVKDGIVARSASVTSKEQADALRGLRLYIPREALPEPDEDEFYLADLIGLSALSPDGEALGRIKAVHDFGAGDLLEIDPGQGRPTWQVAFTREAVPEIDVAAGRLTVVRPEEVSERDEAGRDERSDPG
jgi:16S rRNA processing protein RimM